MKSFDDAKSPVYRSSMSPNQQQVAWKRSSIGQDSSPLRNQMVPTIDPSYRRASQETYGSSSANGAGMTTPNSPGNSVKLCSNSGVYGTQNTYVPELSSMMFPSADPFAYPNQPMITLENRQSIKQENAIEPHMYKLGTPGGTSPPFEHVEYSLMTPYMMQQQQPCLMQNMNPLMSMSGADPGAMHGNDSAWQQHQQQRSGATTGMNLDQLFGEDWGGWMNQGYRQ